MEKKSIIKKQVLLNAPITKVWDALTKAEWTRQYMYGYEVISGWKVGDSILWTTNIKGKQHIRKGKVLQVDQYKFLKISDFNPDSGLEDIDSNYAKVTYELIAENEKSTTLGVTDDFAHEDKRFAESNSFCDNVLSKLKEVIEP